SECKIGFSLNYQSLSKQKNYILYIGKINRRFSASYLKGNRRKSIKHLKNNLEGDIIQSCKGYHI
ncbi:hypothetical protein, partial [Streptococcus oralis]|uniref:hypothetical protein n=1 Tax=Streptococcus oralis TaxID=1303 RepID=UPI00255274E1